jgi:hypothetical protein
MALVFEHTFLPIRDQNNARVHYKRQSTAVHCFEDSLVPRSQLMIKFAHAGCYRTVRQDQARHGDMVARPNGFILDLSRGTGSLYSLPRFVIRYTCYQHVFHLRMGAPLRPGRIG